MLIALIKNEFIKLIKKPKTKILIVLAIIATIIGSVSLYILHEAKIKTDTPEYEIQMLEDSIEFIQKEIEYSKAEIGASEKQDELKQMIKDYKRTIKELEEEKINPKTWQETLEGKIQYSKKNYDEMLMNKEVLEKETLRVEKERIELLEYYLNNNIEPVNENDISITNIMKLIGEIAIIIIPIFIIILGSDIVADESTNETFKFLLIQPTSRGKILLSKFLTLGSMAIGMILSVQAIIFAVVGAFGGVRDLSQYSIAGTRYHWVKRAIYDNSSMLEKIEGSGQWISNGELLFKTYMFQILFIIACCAFVFMISTIVKNDMIAMAISAVLITGALAIPMEMSRGYNHLSFLAYGNSVGIVTGNIQTAWTNENAIPTMGILVMIVTIILSYGIAHIAFNRKEILS